MSWLVGIVKWGASLFATEKAGDVALRIIEKASGVDWTPQQQAQFYIEYQKATAHQSMARRVIAISLTFGMAAFGFTYLVVAVTAKFYVFFATGECDPLLVNSAGESISCLAQITTSQNIAEITVKPLFELENSLLIYMKDVLESPYTYVVSFYFVIGIGSKFKK